MYWVSAMPRRATPRVENFPGALLVTGRPDHAPVQLAAADVQHYVHAGFLVVPGLLTGGEIEALRTDAVAIARGHYPSPQITPAPDSLSDDTVLRSFLAIHQPHFLSPVVRAFVQHVGIAGVLGRIVGAHLPAWDGRVKCMQSMLFVKPPGDPGQAWHQDEIYIPTRDRSLCGAWIALDDASVDNGCLWVLPGSQRLGYLYPQRAHQQPDEFDFAAESYGFDETAEIPVELPAGGVVFFNGYLLHRSRRNRSSGYRRALVSHYMNAWSLLPWEVRAGERPATADRRCVLPICGADPYAWKGYEEPGGVWLRPRQQP